MRASGVAVAVSLALVGLSFADSASAVGRRMTSIPEQDLSSALRELAREHQFSVLARSEIVRDVRTAGAVGEFTTEDALRKLLSGTALTFQYLDEKTIAIVPLNARSSMETAQYGLGTGINLAQASAEVELPEMKIPATSESTAPTQSAKKMEVEEIVVTGSHIRGTTAASPIIAIDSARIREEGFADLGEVIRSVPQNYNGGQNPGVLGALTGSGNISNQNGTGGSGLNLRGLGPDATLTLLNGRRMPYSGFAQTIDISAIPVEAIDRVEIVADGASAIYGSDAVAGVGNVILKRDFDGVTLGARFGTSSDGGLTAREYTGTAGTAWESGGLIATYKTASTDPIYADERDYTKNMDDPNTIYPGSSLRSGLISAHQSIGDSIRIRLDALRTERDQLMYQGYSGLYYDFRTDTKTSLVSAGIDISLPADWTLYAGAGWGKDENTMHLSQVITGSGTSTLAVDACYCNEGHSYEISAEGPLFAMNGSDARLAIGVGNRLNEFHTRNALSHVSSGGEEGSRFAYGEINLPLLGDVANGNGLPRLALTAAVRGEDYDSFGKVTTPKLGLIAAAGADFTLKASWGKSFKAPTLNQIYASRYAYLWNARSVGGVGYPADATVLMSWGGSATVLDPERARTWTASVSYHPEAHPGLEAELSWFDIDYADRVVQPLTATAQSLSNPAFAEFIHYQPTEQAQAELLANYSSAFLNNSGGAYDPSKVVAIGDGHYTNARQQWIKGADLSGSYRFELGSSRLTIRGSASWLDISQQVVAGQDAYELSGNVYWPTELRARLGAVWATGGFTSSIFANFADGVINRTSLNTTERTGSFTTIDTTLRYKTADDKNSLSGLEIALYAQNVFDQAPPLHTPIAPKYVPFDSSNFSAIGRYIGVSISKHW